LVVSLPKDALDNLGLAEGADVSVDVDEEKRQIVISPAKPPLAAAGVDEEFARQINQFIEQYRPVLEALAKE